MFSGAEGVAVTFDATVFGPLAKMRRDVLLRPAMDSAIPQGKTAARLRG